VRDGEDEGRSGSPLPAAAVVADDRDLDTPNCPDCLTRMEAEESQGGEPYWACTECGLVALA
jgi:tRNA(Ile2) C34 agmatinyltransferase TiaS